MYELIQVSESCYYIQCPAKIGLIRTGENSAVIIDSGNDKDAGKKVKKILDANGWTLQAILNTHSHADHIGGNRFLQEKTLCAVYAPGIECDFTLHPVLEPSFLYGGNPPKDLRHKFLMAQGSDARPLTRDVLPDGVELLPLPGHSFDMVGFRTAEDIVYLADCLSSRETLAKYRVSFLVDVAAYLKTLESVRDMKAKLFIPAHAEPTEDISELAQYNIDTVNAVAGDIVALCGAPTGFEELLARLFERYGLTMTFEQHALVGSTVRSYITYLTESGRLNAVIENNRLLWKAE